MWRSLVQVDLFNLLIKWNINLIFILRFILIIDVYCHFLILGEFIKSLFSKGYKGVLAPETKSFKNGQWEGATSCPLFLTMQFLLPSLPPSGFPPHSIAFSMFPSLIVFLSLKPLSIFLSHSLISISLSLSLSLSLSSKWPRLIN